MRGDMPILLTLPIRFERRPRTRRHRRRPLHSALVAALLIALGLALVVVGI